MLRNLLKKKVPVQPEETRRSGEDRRKQIQVDESLRKTSERRNLLQYSTSIIEKYHRLPLFNELSDEQIVKMLRISSKRSYAKDQYIYKKQMDADSIYIILKGQLNIMLRIDDVWETVKPFNCIGLLEFFIDIPRKADVFADTESIVLRISKTEIKRVFETDKDLNVKILRNVIRDLSKRIFSDFDEIETLHYRLKSIDTI
ncbi:cyclic nucleotide-binding domain-containing protein [Candidatus Latescibacterota bacterium]